MKKAVIFDMDGLMIDSAVSYTHLDVYKRQGMGYAFTIDKLFYGDEEIPVTFVPLYPTLETGTVIVWKKHQIFSPAMSRLIEKIRQTFKA